MSKRQYVALYHDPFEGDDYLLRLMDSLQEAQETPRATHVVVFEDGEPIEEYHSTPPQAERIGSYWPDDLPEDACMMSPLPIYSDKAIPERWDGPIGYP